MKIIAITQRVEVLPDRGERRDCLDQRWAELLPLAGLLPLAIPNDIAAATALLSSIPVAGAILTGGGEPASYGGDAPERDAVEEHLYERAISTGTPLLGVCRGMQVIQHHYGVPLGHVSGHVRPTQEIEISGARQTVNSYHDLGTIETSDDLDVWARSDDGVVKAVRHRSAPLWGIMWHPERINPPRSQDIDLIRDIFQHADS
jgi:N5-(cytidine 5'-diphosphoramidyl)-L-glutamine hydrolase